MEEMEKLVDKRGWRIVREASLGLVSFLKINMYKDLEKNESSIKENPIIRAFAGEKNNISVISEDISDFDHDVVHATETYQVVNADSSQQDAILLSQKGVSFVMQGPPGTGKSQTITNIIAQGLADGKKIISTQTYNDVQNTVDKLKTSDATKFYFEPDNMFDDSIQRFYQLKFKATFNGIDYRCMADEIIVFHDKKLVVPVDLKTSSKTEWDFYKSFLEWRYDIQARLYWRIIRDNMDRDPYFKDFKLAPYKFIVANKKTLTPLVWNFRSTESIGDLTLGKITKIVLRDPFKIGEELSHYLKDKPTVPDGISKVSPNQLEDWINKI